MPTGFPVAAPARRHRRVPSPLGELVAVAADGVLVALHLPMGRSIDPSSLGAEDQSLVPDAVAQLEEYFAGTRRDFELGYAGGLKAKRFLLDLEVGAQRLFASP